VIALAAILAAALLGAPARGDGEVVAHLHAEPSDVEVGEPCRFVLEVEHPAGATVRLPEGDLVPDDSWVLLEPRRISRPAPTRTIASWSCVSLEAGERQLPSLRIDVGDASGVRKVDVDAGMLKVRSALAQGEDAPRPMRGFRAPPESDRGRRGRLVLAGATALAILAAAILILKRRRRKPAQAGTPSALDRLAELRRSAAEDEGASRRAVYGLSRLLRGTVDEFLREDRAALVDADWSARIEADERVPLGARRSIARILHDSERIKYALHAPTRFALEEMLAAAQTALEALAAAPVSAPPARQEEAA
jgi:hypothetical protein